jgi:exodeoxyribonuclease VII small subunit
MMMDSDTTELEKDFDGEIDGWGGIHAGIIINDRIVLIGYAGAKSGCCSMPRIALRVDRKPLIALHFQSFLRVALAMTKTPKSSSAAPSASNPSFESALAELEKIVEAMEEGQMPLEQSLAAYKRGAELLKLCQTQLQDAQQQVKILEGGVLKNFGTAE